MSELNERKQSIMEGKDEVKKWCNFHDYNFYQYKGTQRIDKIARNLVDYEAGTPISSPVGFPISLVKSFLDFPIFEFDC